MRLPHCVARRSAAGMRAPDTTTRTGMAQHLNPSAATPSQFVVGLGEKVAPTDIEEGMRVG